MISNPNAETRSGIQQRSGLKAISTKERKVKEIFNHDVIKREDFANM